MHAIYCIYSVGGANNGPGERERERERERGRDKEGNFMTPAAQSIEEERERERERGGESARLHCSRKLDMDVASA